MRKLAVLGVAFVCVHGCGSDDARSTGPSSAGQGGEAGDGSSVSGGEAGRGAAGDAPVAGVSSTGGATAVGSAGEAGSSEAGARATTIGIVGEQTHFLEYGTLRIAFDQPIEAASLTLRLTPQRPARLVVTQVSQVDATTVDAALSYYHLPIDYRLEVTGELADSTRFRAAFDVSGANNGSRVAFMSQQTGSGDFTSWANVPAAATALEAVDAVCQREADAAGLRGKFQAFVSAYGVEDAGCRALGHAGTVADKCGAASLPVDHAPILSLDGTPIVAGGSGVLGNHWAIPFGFYADGSPATPDYTFTGTLPSGIGYADDDCDHWTSTAHLGITTVQVANHIMDYGFGRACTNVGDVVCMQTVGTFFGPSTLHEVNGKRAFVSKGHLYGNMSFGGKSGVAAADALCQSEAQTATLPNADKFHAYLGTAATDALCYVLGKTGKVADNCGLAALPSTDPWRRADNYPIGSAAELAAGKLQAPLALAVDGTLLIDERPRTGTDQNGATAENCGDWTSTASYSISGNPGYATSDWTSHWTTGCSTEQTSVYCFEN